MRLNKLEVLICLILFCSTLYAQTSENIQSDRPGNNISANVVGLHVLQVQAGFDLETYQRKYSSAEGKVYKPNWVFRYGLTDKFEINGSYILKGINEYGGNSSSSYYSEFGLAENAIGARFNIVKAKNYRPAISMQVLIRLPFVSEHYQDDEIAPKITLAVSQKLTPRVNFRVNLSLNYDDRNQPEGIYVLRVDYSMNKKLGLFFANNGNYQNKIFYSFYAGFYFLIDENFQFDVYGGNLSTSRTVRDQMASIGFSWRFSPKQKKEPEQEDYKKS